MNEHDVSTQPPAAPVSSDTPSVVPSSEAPASYISAKRYRKAGLWLVIVPFVVLVGVLVLWAIMSFTMARSASAAEIPPAFENTVELRQPQGYTGENLGFIPSDESLRHRPADLRMVAGSIVSVILGLVGLLCVLAIAICVPLGIVFLCKKELAPGIAYDERSGKGPASIVPAEVKGGWNWGAAGLPFVWGAYYNVWMFLIGWIPFVGLIWWIVMGLKGNEWAWRKYKWLSVEQFKASQRKWMVLGIIFFILQVLFIFNDVGDITREIVR